MARSRGGVRCLSTAVTKVPSQFGNDEGQQMFVPTRMTIEKPDASATYTNRRFRVSVQETLQTPR